MLFIARFRNPNLAVHGEFLILRPGIMESKTVFASDYCGNEIYTSGQYDLTGNSSRKREKIVYYDKPEIDRQVHCKIAMSALVLSILNHALTVVFTLYIIYHSLQSNNLFSWHPSLMTFGSFLLMAEAVMAISPDNIGTTKLERQGKVRIHWMLQACATSCVFIGFLIIVINKNISNKEHFKTWHAIFGLASVILMGITSGGGVIALFTVRLKHVIRPSIFKLVHNVFGIITFTIGAIAIIFGLLSSWFYQQAGYIAQIICSLIVMVSSILTLNSAVKSAYTRSKNLSHHN